ncbi:MAG: endolytic transglycosylase MltG [Melioribacteraceae bacterium]|nr:endolytic transglycosylase MltG [Melioribacteraceae bacterium]
MIHNNKYIKYFNLTNNEISLIIGLWSFIFGFLLFTFLGPNYYDTIPPKDFEVKNGDTFTKVVQNLYDEKIISSSTNMNIAAFLYGAETKVKAGHYSIPNGLNYFQLIELFIEGTPGKQILVTIPEGIWQHNLSDLLVDKVGIDGDKFMELSRNKSFLNSLNIVGDNLEGYLLPDTYYFFRGSSASDIIKKLKYEMDKIFKVDSVIVQMAKIGLSKNEVLTLASIIDGETNKESELKLISGVYHNRLKRGMKLQADPTIQYLKRHRRSKNKVFYKDLEIDSPYNTYKNKGIPPSPINNPGKNAVLAAIFPEKTDYIFFVADGTGGHKFAVKLSEHNRNVSAYRRWRNSQ